MKLLAFSALLPATLAQLTGTYTQIPPENISPNPSNVVSYIYLPKTLAASPPVVVVPHWCHGSASAAFQGSPFSYPADQYGFIAIYPDSPNTADKCWDVASNATLTHNGGGDSTGIVSALKYVMAKYNVDRRRVFVQGTSSGAMMTNVLLGTYPELFAAGSAWAGVALGCFAGPSVDYWNNDCATGQVVKSGAQWKAIVQAADPGYAGWRPKMQVFHGSADTTLYPQNLEEEVKEWTAVLGLSETPTQVLNDTPIAGWTKRVFGTEGRFEATLASGVTHNIQTQVDTVLAWFDLNCTGDKCYGRPDVGSGGGSGSSSSTVKTSTSTPMPQTTSTVKPQTTSDTVRTSSSSTKVSTTSSAAGGQSTAAAQWAQCGGKAWTGPTTCVAPYKCNVLNEYYSQCF